MTALLYHTQMYPRSTWFNIHRLVALCTLVLCCANCLAQTDEEESVSTFCGVSAGWKRSVLGPITAGPAGLTDPPVNFPVSFGPTGSVEAGSYIPITKSLGLNTALGFGLSHVSMTTTTPGFVYPKGEPIPVTFRENLELQWYELLMRASLQYRIGNALEVSVGAGAVLPGSVSARAEEYVIDPPDATYDERTRQRLRFSGALVTRPTVTFDGRIAYRLPLTTHLDIVPFAEFRAIPYSFASQVDLTTASVSIGAQFRLATTFFSAPVVEPVILTAPRLTPEMLANQERKFDTPLPEISMIRRPYLATAVQVQLTDLEHQPKSKADVVVRVLNCLRLRLIDEHVDASSTIWDATKFELIHKDSILDATPPTALIRVRSTAEGGVQSGVVRAMSGGALAFENHWSSSTDTVFAWPLRELPVTALAGDTTTISIQSTLNDHFGGESVSVPQNIVVIRSRPSKRSALVPDLVTADFTPRTFLAGSDDLSKAGRGLVAALTDHAREARVIRFRGSPARCMRVLRELAPTGNVKVEMPNETTTSSEDDAVVVIIER